MQVDFRILTEVSGRPEEIDSLLLYWQIVTKLQFPSENVCDLKWLFNPSESQFPHL